jgi:hypothetical protein
LGGTLCKIGSPLLSFLLCSLCTPLQDFNFTHFLHTLAECKGVSKGFCLIVNNKEKAPKCA